MQNSGKKCFLALKMPYAIQEDQSKLDTLLKESSCLWGKVCIQLPCLTDVQLAKISFILSRLCVSKHFAFGMEDSWCSCFINLPRACQGLLAPVQCHLEACVGRIPCGHEMHARFERLNSWSPPFLSQRCCGSMRVARVGMTLWMCLTWPAVRQCLLCCLWPSASRALSREGLVGGRAVLDSAAQESCVCWMASPETQPYWMASPEPLPWELRASSTHTLTSAFSQCFSKWRTLCMNKAVFIWCYCLDPSFMAIWCSLVSVI